MNMGEMLIKTNTIAGSNLTKAKIMLKRISSAVCVLISCLWSVQAQDVPTIVTQPISQTNLVGFNATFSVAVSGTGPLAYQWQFYSTNLTACFISTIAGNGDTNYAGDGVLATNAAINFPSGVAADALGNIYFSDGLNNRIRKVDTNGYIRLVAGGIGGFGGDGGLATSARLNLPAGLALDAVGNLYIADFANERIRKVGTNGIIKTVAGNGGINSTGDGGPATSATIYGPRGVASDAVGTLYIADYFNHRVRKVATNGIITTVAGNGQPGYSGDGVAAVSSQLYYPEGVALDTSGNLYIADSYNNRVRVVTTNGIINTVAGSGSYGASGDGGLATNATLTRPSAVAFDVAGNLYVADEYNSRVRKIDTSGFICTVAGSDKGGKFAGDGGVATNASLNNPYGVASDCVGNLLIADSFNNRLRKVLLSAASSTFIRSSGSTSNAGNYTVVVSSPYGSVTSAVATLTVTTSNLLPQVIFNDTKFGFQSNIFGFSVRAAGGQKIIIDSSTDLVNWIPLSTNSMRTIPVYFDDSASTHLPSRFYRARSP